MSQSQPNRRTKPAVRSPQNLVSGLILVAAAVFVVWMLGNLSQGTLRVIGPAMVPRWSAAAIGLAGLALVVLAFIQEGDALERWHLRGPAFVLAGIALFAATIRQPGFIVAAPLAMLVAGFGSREVRPRELVIFTLVMTAACALLFRFALNQPIPMLVLPAFSINF
ncbi:tripartite tricarboxylate transporter TctB family protein [Bosea sp. (in: a-proteobacteria)]|uniref:tripartite tricarboxylate transporter TctB family protein n=1 Tax=Bosea sp. (in: a-proteobacteria) TaxID=1871050 RepID=UPI002FCC6F04